MTLLKEVTSASAFNIVLGGFVGGHPKSHTLANDHFFRLEHVLGDPHILVGMKFSARSEKITRRR